jgi:hypothetical protein
MATIEARGSHQFRVKIRRNGVSQNKTFETRRAAEDWARLLEGKVSGDDFVDHGRARETTLSKALDWYEDDDVKRMRRTREARPARTSGLSA